MFTEAALAEKAKYDDVWRRPEYRVKSHGLYLWQQGSSMFPDNFDSVIDLGCGHGRFFAHMAKLGKDAHAVDFDIDYLDADVRATLADKFHAQCLWQLDIGRSFDLGVCTDVMEHVPEEHVLETFRRIFAHCRYSIFKIANHSSLSLGHDLHPTRKPPQWWVDMAELAGGEKVKLAANDWPRQSSFIITVGY